MYAALLTLSILALLGLVFLPRSAKNAIGEFFKLVGALFGLMFLIVGSFTRRVRAEA